MAVENRHTRSSKLNNMATKKPVTKKSEATVINQLIVKAPTRKTHDIGEWRNALKSADMGRTKTLYELFDDLLIDGVLSDAVEKRILAVLNSELTFQDASGKDNEEMTAVIDTPAFEEMLRTIMNVLLWGRAGGELDFANGFGFVPFDPRHISLETKNILLNPTDTTGIPYEGDDHLLVLGKPRNFGLLLKTAPFAIWKRGGFGDYAQWLEIFGMPQRVGKYSSYDPESRKLLEQALEQAGSAPYVVIPKESEVETTNNTGSGSSGVSYNDFRKACNEEILITLLGQTLTTTQNDTGARSLGEVHKEVEESKNKADIRMVQRVLNTQVLPLLESRGFPVSGGKFVFPDAAVDLTVTDIVQLSDILEIPQSYLHDKYSIPVPENGEPIARRAASPAPVLPGEDDDEGDDIKNADRTVFRRLFNFFALAPASLSAGAGSHPIKLNDETLNDRIISHAIEQGGFFPELFEFISDDLLTALTRKAAQLADLGFEYGYQSDAFRTAQELNIFQFSAAKSLAEVQRLNELYRESKSFEDFYAKASAEVDVFNKTWQRTEWQTANLLNESAENYNRLNSKTRLFPFWEYRTVGDDKVRKEHRDINGIILPTDDPRWQKIWPPNGWKCRCYVVARMRHEVTDTQVAESRARVDAFFQTDEWKRAQASGFGVNRASMPEVFAENQQYIRKFPNQASKLLKDVNYHSYGLKNYETNRKAATTALPVYESKPADFVAALKQENGVSLATDYKGRTVEFDLTAKGDSQLLKAAYETLKLPDEVWINEGNTKVFDQIITLKYYTDKVMTVTSSIKGGKVYKVSRFEVAKETGEKYRYRHGLLIKKPQP
jgi:SPP1 gp7 family putative phage head morphogenesis protein